VPNFTDAGTLNSAINFTKVGPVSSHVNDFFCDIPSVHTFMDGTPGGTTYPHVDSPFPGISRPTINEMQFDASKVKGPLSMTTPSTIHFGCAWTNDDSPMRLQPLRCEYMVELWTRRRELKVIEVRL